MFDRFFLKLKVNGLRNPGIYGNILLGEYLHHRDPHCAAELVQGYLTLGNQTCWHVWVDDGGGGGGRPLDIIRASVESDVDFEYATEVPAGTTAERDDEITRQYELYLEDRKEFWKQAPAKVKNFRAKMFRKDFM